MTFKFHLNVILSFAKDLAGSGRKSDSSPARNDDKPTHEFFGKNANLAAGEEKEGFRRGERANNVAGGRGLATVFQ